MKRFNKFILLIVVSLLLGVLLTIHLFGNTTISKAAPLKGFWSTHTAYDHKVAFRTDGGTNPHFGAFFSGQNGYNQHYLGPGGDGATSGYDGGISNWNWWGNGLYVLLTPKTWVLFNPIEGQNPSNYQATLYMN